MQSSDRGRVHSWNVSSLFRETSNTRPENTVQVRSKKSLQIYKSNCFSSAWTTHWRLAGICQLHRSARIREHEGDSGEEWRKPSEHFDSARKQQKHDGRCRESHRQRRPHVQKVHRVSTIFAGRWVHWSLFRESFEGVGAEGRGFRPIRHLEVLGKLADGPQNTRWDIWTQCQLNDSLAATRRQERSQHRRGSFRPWRGENLWSLDDQAQCH